MRNCENAALILHFQPPPSSPLSSMHCCFSEILCISTRYCVYTQNGEREERNRCDGSSEREKRASRRDDEDAMEVNDTTFMLSIQSLSIIANYIFSISLFSYNSEINVISQSVLYAIYASPSSLFFSLLSKACLMHIVEVTVISERDAFHLAPKLQHDEHFFLCEQKLQLLLLFHFQFIWFKTLNFFLPNSSRQLRDSRTTRGGKEECLAWNGKTDEREDEEANGVKKFHWMVQMMRVITLIEFLNEVSTRQRERRLLLLHIFIMMRKIHAFWCILPISRCFSRFSSYSRFALKLQFSMQLCNKRKAGTECRWRVEAILNYWKWRGFNVIVRTSSWEACRSLPRVLNV